jgi:hypothetical protein
LAISLLRGQKHYTNIATVKDIVMADIIKKLETFESKYGEKIAAWAIVTIVAYLIIAQ